MTKRTVKSIIFVLMLLTIALYFIAGTYARYTESWTGTGTVAVAKWAVALKSGEAAVTDSLTLTFKPVANTHVVSGKIAPNVELEADVEINLTGTEVAVDVEAKVVENDLKAALTEYGTVPEDIKVTAKVDDETSGSETIELPSGQAFNGENAKKMLKITVKWTNDDDHSAADTKAGKAADKLNNLSIPVTLTVKQHIEGA